MPVRPSRWDRAAAFAAFCLALLLLRPFVEHHALTAVCGLGIVVIAARTTRYASAASVALALTPALAGVGQLFWKQGHDLTSVYDLTDLFARIRIASYAADDRAQELAGALRSTALLTALAGVVLVLGGERKRRTLAVLTLVAPAALLAKGDPIRYRLLPAPPADSLWPLVAWSVPAVTIVAMARRRGPAPVGRALALIAVAGAASQIRRLTYWETTWLPSIVAALVIAVALPALKWTHPPVSRAVLHLVPGLLVALGGLAAAQHSVAVLTAPGGELDAIAARAHLPRIDTLSPDTGWARELAPAGKVIFVAADGTATEERTRSGAGKLWVDSVLLVADERATLGTLERLGSKQLYSLLVRASFDSGGAPRLATVFVSFESSGKAALGSGSFVGTLPGSFSALTPDTRVEADGLGAAETMTAGEGVRWIQLSRPRVGVGRRHPGTRLAFLAPRDTPLREVVRAFAHSLPQRAVDVVNEAGPSSWQRKEVEQVVLTSDKEGLVHATATTYGRSHHTGHTSGPVLVDPPGAVNGTGFGSTERTPR